MQGDNTSKAKFFEERAHRTKNLDRRSRYMKAAERYRLAARNEKQSEPQRAGVSAHVIEMDA